MELFEMHLEDAFSATSRDDIGEFKCPYCKRTFLGEYGTFLNHLKRCKPSSSLSSGGKDIQRAKLMEDKLNLDLMHK